MLNKIVVLIFVGMASVTSMSAFAVNDKQIPDSTNSLSIVNAPSTESVETEAAKVKNNNQNIVSSGSINGETTLPAPGWMLGIALLGFVVLSNRSSL